MSHWQDSPETLRKLAAAYALGTLAGPARRRFEAVMARQPLAAEAVAAWNRRFVPLAAQLPAAPAQPALWARIEQAAFAELPTAMPAAAVVTPPATPATPAVTPETSPRVSDASPMSAPARQASRNVVSAPSLVDRVRQWFDALLAPVPAAALAAGLALGLVLPGIAPLLRGDELATELPESYVGVLATVEGRTGLIVSSLRHGQVVDLKRVVPVAVPPGRELVLWVIDAQGRSTRVGTVPDGPFVRVKLDAPAEQVFAKAVELGVSAEAPGTVPATPAGFVYRGLCGKLWRVPAPR